MLWEFLDEVLLLLNDNIEGFTFTHARTTYDYTLVNKRLDMTNKNYILYLNAIVNHNIWRYSKKIQHENELFNIYQLIRNVVKTLFARKRMEDKLKQCSKIDNIENLCTAANFVKNVYLQSIGSQNSI